MVINQITNDLEKRRSELVEMLENNRDSLDLEKQHQVYGAINEIDLFLSSLDFYQKNSDGESPPVRLIRPPEEEKGVFSKFYQGLMDKVKKNK